MSDIPDGYQARRLTLDDVEEAARVINACFVAESGDPFTTPAQLRADLTAPGHSPDDDVLLVSDDGAAVGVMQLWADVPPHTELTVFAWVLPELWGRGLSTALLRLGEERARSKLPLSPPERRVVIHAGRFANNRPAGELFRREGFTHARDFRDMRIELGTPPPAAVPVPGIEIRTFVRGRDEGAVHATLTEAFQDHWGHDFPPFEHFVHHMIESEAARFDPSRWWLATDDEHVVGASLCRVADRDPRLAIVDELGVRRAWRGRGIGMALLLTSFAGLRDAGFESVELGVDAESLTGATRLYERAGMHVAKEWEIWEKELRPAAD